MRDNYERRLVQHDFWDLRGMVASTRAAPLAAQTPSAAADDDRDEPLGDRRLLEARLAESHQGVFIFPPNPPFVIVEVRTPGVDTVLRK